MNYDTLKDLLKQADEFNNTGKYDEAKERANEVLAELEKAKVLIVNQTVFEIETLHCSALITLSTSNWQSSDFQTALLLAQAALDLAVVHSIPDLKAKALDTIGIVYRNLSDFTKALEYHQNAMAIEEELGNKAGIARNIGYIGVVYHKLSDYPKEIECYQKALNIYEELNNKDGIAYILRNIGLVYNDLSNYNKALENFQNSLAIFEELDSRTNIARILCDMGIVYHHLGDYLNALECNQNAMAINVEFGTKNGIANNLSCIGIVYLQLLDYDKALEYLKRSIAINEALGSKKGVATDLGNIGYVYQCLTDYANALEYMQQALAIFEELDVKNGIASNFGNIGSVYLFLSDYTNALVYMQKALSIFEELGSKSGIAINLGNIGNVYATLNFDGYDALLSEQYLRKALEISREIQNKANEYSCNKSLADLYKGEKRWEEAFVHLEQYMNVEKEVQSEEAKKQAILMEQRRQAEEREKEIAIAKAAADAKHQATEQLLHNVLPPSIAAKMLTGSTLIAEKLPTVSVLFADIVNFTKLSQRITPEELVEGLDRIFSTFDALAEKHGLEKIKTIGDAYMVVSGAPIPRSDHAEAMANFALEMVDAMKEFRSISTGEEIQIRIGIHSGEVVAGVIGKKKFAYDMWGDAVNTASRMESHGEPGKIHVSEEFARNLTQTLSKRDGFSELESSLSSSFPFGDGRDGVLVERGEMTIKGKGKMTTYFLERI